MAHATLKRTSMALLVAACCAGATANPTLPQVVNGQATFSQHGKVFSITNTPGTIIDWQAFSVAPGELTRFIQQSDSSAVLNRIVGQDPSQILGALQSNGRVFLINPNGILFGRDARIDVNGLTASTLNLSNADFLAGKGNFAAGPVAGGIANQGAITTPAGGRVFLIAPDIDNSGIITSPQGEVVLAAGRTVQLVDSSSPDLHVVVAAPADQSLNLGQIIAHGGKIGIYGALVKQRGLVSADSAVAGENGKIVFKASADTVLEAGSVTSATGAGRGGAIELLGKRVGITGDARIDASGAQGGGTVMAGGGFQGKNPNLMNAQQTVFGKGASIRADATTAGNGGTVVLWSDASTRAFGRISARGGAASGNGGLVETSGNILDVNGIAVDTGAAHGAIGSWLLDPLDINIAASGSAVISEVDGFEKTPADPKSMDPSVLVNASTNMVLQAKHDVVFGAPVSIAASGVDLTVQAGNNISVNQALNSNGGDLVFKANDSASGSATGGAVFVNAALNSGGGKIDISGTSVTFANAGSAVNTGGAGMVLRANTAGGSVSLASGTSLAGTGKFELIADSLTLAGAINAGGASGTSIVVMKPYTANRAISIAAGAVDATLTVTPGDLANISAHQINIGDSSTTGALNVSAPFTAGAGQLNSLILETSGNISISNAIDLSTNNANSYLLAGLYGTGQISVSGALKAASVVLRGDQMTLGAGAGITANSVTLSPNSAASAIMLGAGATDSSTQLGLDQDEISKITATEVTIGGTGQSGAVTVGGALAMPAGSDRSLTLKSGSGGITLLAALSAPGPVSLVSEGGAVTASGGTVGATSLYAKGSSVDLRGDNPVGVVAGQASAGDFRYHSVNVVSVQSLTPGSGITASGEVELTSVEGISLEADVSAASVRLAGWGGAVSMASGATVSAATAINIEADQMKFDSAAHLSTPAGQVSLMPRSVGRDIELGTGATDASTVLGLSQAELLTIDSHSLSVSNSGEGVAGTVRVVGALDLSASPHLASTTISSGSGLSVGAPMKLPGALVLSSGLAMALDASVEAADSVALHGHGGIAGSGVIKGGSVSLNSYFGIGSADTPVDTQTAALSASNIHANGSAPIHIRNNFAVPRSMVLGAVTQSDSSNNGAIIIDNYGGMTVAGPVSANGGSIKLATHSPLTISGNVTTTSGDIALEAGGSGDLTIVSPALVHSSTGAISLKAGSTITAPDGSVTTGGTITLAPSQNTPPPVVVVPPPPPTVNECLVTPSASGCTEILAQALTNCISNPTAASCTGVLPTLATCTTDPSATGCAVVLPTLATCVASPTAAGCSVVLPSLSACVASPLASGCSAVLPSLDACVATPQASGCSVVLPSLNACVSAPLASGCSVVLPSLSACVSAPLASGCSVVLPSLSACVSAPLATGCSVVLPSLATCVATPLASGCSAVLPSLNTCLATPLASGCGVVLPSLNTCVASPVTLGCSVVLPSLGSCVAQPTLTGCAAVLPSLSSCTVAAATPGCSAVLPTLFTCVAAPATPGCSAVLPTLAACTVAPATAGCSAVLPTLDACAAAPSMAGCSAVLPTLAACTASPAMAGCLAVLPTLSICTLAPATAGCSAILPTLAACTLTPATAGCSAVLPTLLACTAAPSAAGCSAVLPTLAACTLSPTTAACSVVLPTLAACTLAPATAGCSVVLPTLPSCIANPTLAGCGAVLPTLTSCVANPSQAGCSAVLPTLTSCVANPTRAGCSAVLPTLTSCVANPTQAGCSVVLPTLTSCIANPTQAGCSVVLPSLISCMANSAVPGCARVLPSLTSCIATPVLTGCSVVLPSLASCTANPAVPGCSVVLPSLSSCAVNPTLTGCVAVLPSLASCVANTALPGCTAVLPTLSQCVANTGLAGCSSVLPSLSQCTIEPVKAGCSVVLPTLAQCAVSPSLQGCVAVLPTVSSCVANPSAPGCAVVMPPVASPEATSTPVAQAIQTTVQIINTTTARSSPASTSGTSSTSSTSSTSAAADTGSEAKSEKKDEATKSTEADSTKSGVKNEPAKKMYCN